MSRIPELSSEELYRKCDPQQLGFETTAEIEEEVNIVGQERAFSAISLSMNISHPGYNIFVLGPTGMGKREIVQNFFEERAATDTTPPDWIYVHNFKTPDEPEAIELPPGKGSEYVKDIDGLIEEMQTALSAAFKSEEYQNRRQGIIETFKEKQSELFNDLQEKANQKGLAMIKTPSGIAFAPRDDEGVLSPDEVNKLSEEERDQIAQNIKGLQEVLQKILQQVPVWQREAKQEIKEINIEMANFAIGGLINELIEKYNYHNDIVEHIKQIQDQVVENADGFLPSDEQEPTHFIEVISRQQNGGIALMEKFKVNLIIDNSERKGAPVIFENNPTYPNLIGRVEHYAQMGMLRTDYRMIKPGAMHSANGGYLIMDARKLLTQPYAWEGLKRALQSKEIEIESIGQALSLISTVSLKPEPVPLNLKIALVGDRLLYYLLVQYDPEFSELFKVEADFETEIEWDETNQELYAKMIATVIKNTKTRPFKNSAVARLIEQSARQTSDSERLNTHLQDLSDLIIESDYWANKNGHEAVIDLDVQKAIDTKIQRADRLREKFQKSILRDINLISTEGEVIGQINGLSVYSLGAFMFGKPTRITAQISLGKGQVLDIEREVETGGPIHSKGVLILAGFLKGRYAQEVPLSLSASMVFEQSYGGVDGDSASSTELFALLSAIAEVPIKQNIAVTGSVNQHGEIQAIGGVNQKVEGFYDICKQRGLTGNQGVLIPKSNIIHLMLRRDVVKSVKEDKFHIYPVDHIDEGIEILTGIKSGEKQTDGSYPDNSFNAIVNERLEYMARKLSEFGKASGSNSE
ncbi:MAG: ATP-binding protein [Chloroflexota bacterium]|nr:ATP-binding protein [Chloroflexota bacterium]